MPEISVAGDRLHFTDQGEGPLLLFVHGSCGGSGQWQRLIELLADDFRCVAVDLLGMGESEPFPLERVWRVEDDERAIGALIDHLGGPFHFVGHSGGCVFSWRALQARADRVLSVALFEPVFFGLLQEVDDPLHDWARDLGHTFRTRIEAGDPDGAMAAFVDRWAGVDGVWASMPGKIRAMMEAGRDRLYHEWGYRLLPQADFLARDMSEPSAPMLLVEGSATHSVMRGVCDLIAKSRPDAERLVIEEAGHMVPFTHFDQAADAVRAHVAAAG